MNIQTQNNLQKLNIILQTMQQGGTIRVKGEKIESSHLSLLQRFARRVFGQYPSTHFATIKNKITALLITPNQLKSLQLSSGELTDWKTALRQLHKIMEKKDATLNTTLTSTIEEIERRQHRPWFEAIDQAMTITSRKKDYSKLKNLLDQGLDINATNDGGQTAFEIAMRNHKLPLANFLISKGAQEAVDEFIKDAARGNLNNLKERERIGLDINSQDSTGKTALMAAAGNGNQRIVQWLLEHGANPALKDKTGLTAMDYVTNSRRMGTWNILSKAPLPSQQVRHP